MPGKVPRILKGLESVIICDLCGGDPECVRVCRMAGYGALEIAEVSDDGDKVRRLYARTPDVVTAELVRKVYGLEPEEVM